MTNYKGKRIVIIGLGLTGLSCIRFFLTRGIVPCVMDTRTVPPNLNKVPKQIKLYLGSLNKYWLMIADLIVVSPGIDLMNPILKNAADAGIEIIGDIELFCREAQAPIIAITGSNGKSTVTSLVGKIAKAAGINVGIGGNIGLPALTLLNTAYELYILELSSFQLETTFSLQTIAATVLNITEDHMDRYPFGLQQYRTAKLRIYNNAEVCVFNADDILTLPNNNSKNCISFGINNGDYHLNFRQNEVWLHANGENLLNVREIMLSGKHNYTNILAALVLADVAGISREFSLRVITTFVGLKHCFQLVLEHKGIRWINDSKATNISSTKAALDNLQVKGTLYLLLGGNSKTADISSLKPYLMGDKIKIYCFGQDRKKLAELRYEIAKQTETLEEAIHLIIPVLKHDDVVLLSPACSSIDQFKSFKQRGSLFVRLAKELS